jgi:hypothetical protein
MSGDRLNHVAGVTDEQALQILRDRGYTDVTALRPSGEGWNAAATRNGQKVQVVVDNYGSMHEP